MNEHPGKVETNDEKIARLEKANLELTEKLNFADEERRKAEQAAASQILVGGMATEVPCGERMVDSYNSKGELITVRRQKRDGDDELMFELDAEGAFILDHKNQKKPLYEYVAKQKAVPIFKYRIDIPPSAGWSIMLGGIPLIHGQVYELTLDELRTVKDIVGKSWQHERGINGQANENAYRKPSEVRLGMSGGRVVEL